MKKIFLGVVLLIYGVTIAKHAITYNLGGARFGDKILGYAQARYLSYITSIPFLYRPFNFSDQLFIDYDARSYDRHAHEYESQFHIHSSQTFFEFFKKIGNENCPPTLFILDYFPSDISEWDNSIVRAFLGKNQLSLLLNIPWYDQSFNDYLKNSLKPRVSIPDFTKPDRLNMAVHVRTLSGADNETSLITFPLKHPDTSYHKKQIKRVYELNLQRPTYVFLFSDTDKPLELLESFRRDFFDSDIVFDIQTLKNPDLNNTVQDFFAMQKFDVLIATQSNFSMMASRCKIFDMVIFPIHFSGSYPHCHIDRVQMISKKSSWFPSTLNVVWGN